MKNNPWQDITPGDYDAHMSHPNVAQTQMLSRITKEQFGLLPQAQIPNAYVAILGITNGNGLEHIVSLGIKKVIGIDINEAFLNECRTRFSQIESRLDLFQLDLTTDTAKSIEILSNCDLIIANLLIKHIRLENFMKIIAGLPKRSQIVSCVIQINPDGEALSKSGFEYVFDGVSKQRESENESLIISSMAENGFNITNRIVYDLPNGKQFIRLDFVAVI